jgi:hypothetical protein
MAYLNRSLMLLYFLTLLSLLVLTVTPVIVQAASKPSIPQFSVKLIDNSYDVPPSTTTVTDLYTGKETITTNSGYRVEKYDVEITIKNQPFKPYTNADDGYVCENIYYAIQAKPHFGEVWGSYAFYNPSENIEQSSSKETVVTFTLTDNGCWAQPPPGGQLDFRVEAYTGYWKSIPREIFSDAYIALFRYESSGWSNIKTITMPYDSSLTPLSQTATQPADPTTTADNNSQIPLSDFVLSTNFLLGLIALLLCVIVALVILFINRQSKVSNMSTTSVTHPPNSIESYCLRSDGHPFFVVFYRNKLHKYSHVLSV